MDSKYMLVFDAIFDGRGTLETPTPKVPKVKLYHIKQVSMTE